MRNWNEKMNTRTDTQTSRDAHLHEGRHTQRSRHTPRYTHTCRVAASPVINLPAQLIKRFPWGVAGASLKPRWRAPSAAEHSHRALEPAAPRRMTGGNNCLNYRMRPDSHVWPLCCVWFECRGGWRERDELSVESILASLQSVLYCSGQRCYL